jgi:hypothetical protein
MHVRFRFWIDVAVTSLTVGLFLLTLFSRNWIEVLFGIDPDHGDGSFEWIIVGGLLVASIALVALTRAEWRRFRVLAN